MPFRGDERGVSSVVGFVLVIGILVLLLAINQSQIVPSQNEGTEFQHSQTVQRDMIELRNAILDARTTGENGFAEVQLGTQYQTRIFAVNPPPPSGSLRTADPEPIIIEDSTGDRITDVCPAGDPIETRTLRYTPDYAEYREAPTLVYENTVLYMQFENRTLTLTDQQLVEREGSTVNLAPLNTSFGRASSDTVSIEIIPGRLTNQDVSDGTITTPTGLSEATWEDLLAGQVPPDDVTVSNGNLTVTTSGRIRIGCSPTGLNAAPPGGQRVGGTDLNPLDVQIREFNRPSNEVVEVTYNNTLERDANVSRMRLTFYHNPDDTGGEIGPLDVVDPDGNTVASLVELGEFETADPTVTLPGNRTETVLTFRNTGGEKIAQRDFFVVDLIFESGEERRYFIDVPA
jgi:hypothetical protein